MKDHDHDDLYMRWWQVLILVFTLAVLTWVAIDQIELFERLQALEEIHGIEHPELETP